MTKPNQICKRHAWKNYKTFLKDSFKNLKLRDISCL